MRKWQSAAFAGTAAALLLTAACGTEAAKQNQDTVQPAAGTGATTGGGYGYGSDDYGTAPQGGATKREPAKQLTVKEDNKLGNVVTDSKGFTLYRFDKDTAKPPKSNCNGDCEKAWPVVPANDATATDGIDPDLISEVVRADGTRQLTLAGWPVYRYAKDTAAGQTNGQGVGGTWHALAPNGGKAGSEEAGKKALLSVEKNSELGEILVDGQGRTLYAFTKDNRWPMRTACTGKCLETWKPAKAINASEADGVNPKLISPFTRPDGTKQLSVDCWLLYWFTGDLKPGDVNGQGVNGTWFAITKDGKLVKDTPAASGTSGGSSSGAY